MSYVLNVEAPGKIGVAEYEERPLAPAEVRVRTLHSGISAGTELTLFKGSNPYLTKSWDNDRRIFVPSNNSWAYPMGAIGYEEVGEVIELGSDVADLALGDIVWGTWGHKSTHIGTAEWARNRRMPKGADPLLGI